MATITWRLTATATPSIAHGGGTPGPEPGAPVRS